MALTRKQKEKIVEELKENVDRQKAMVFVDFSGLKTAELFALKNMLSEENAILKVCKKTLLNFVFKEKKIGVEPKDLPGQMALIFAFGDETGPIKKVFQFSQNQGNLKILAGFLEGKARDAEYIKMLAQLPSKQELLARLLGSVSAPLADFVSVLIGNLKGLIYVLAKAKI